ncbi:hypothetical protein ACFVY1_47450 [Streptomyces sp. NPDC058293]|uniref:hypothetical protein n=1 Tax=Streptomyces sp. NPDC058293 TaxID=3346429 RepID=UPI0036EFA893
MSTTTRQLGVPAPGRFAPESEARLDRLDRDATAHVEGSRPQKTRDGYTADWNAWLRFRAETDLPRPPSAPAPS